MSVSKDLRRFLAAQPGVTITQIAEGINSELSDPDNGMIWFGRRNTEPARTLTQATGIPERQFFDIEIYHPDPDVVEATVNTLHMLDCYRGEFGNGEVQGFFVDTQSDDYIPRVEFSDAVAFEAAFLNIEIRCYTE